MDKSGGLGPVRQKYVLLPYHREIARTIGISDDEMRSFLIEAQSRRRVYPAPGAANVPQITAGPVGLIFAAVGLVFQVVGLLLRPDAPEAPRQRNRAQVKPEERFSPTFGFNSLQELARYGEIVAWVHTSDSVINSLTEGAVSGKVRVNTRLVWSYVEGVGKTQIASLLTLLGAGKVTAIDLEGCAFGQTLLTNAGRSRFWLYWRPGDTADQRPTTGEGLQQVGGWQRPDPTLPPGFSGLIYEAKPNATTRQVGYSQAIQPASSATFGVYEFFPVDVLIRGDGREDDGVNTDNAERDVRITPSRTWNGSDVIPPEITTIELEFRGTNTNYGEDISIANIADANADQIRRRAWGSLAFGVDYIFGTALWQLDSIDPDDVDAFGVGTPFRCTFRRISEGRWPFAERNSRAIRERACKTKGFAKYEEANYSSLSDSRIFSFSLKYRAFRLIQNRGSGGAFGDPSQNGYQEKHIFFKVFWKPRGEPVSEFQDSGLLFALVGRNPSDLYTNLTFRMAAVGSYDFRFQPVLEPEIEINIGPCGGPCEGVAYIDALSPTKRTHLTVEGIEITWSGPALTQTLKAGPRDRYSDQFGLPFYAQTDQSNYFSSSNDSGPEVTIFAVNEQQAIADDATLPLATYPNFSTLAVNAYAGRGLTDLSQFSGLVTEGHPVPRFDPGGNIGLIDTECGTREGDVAASPWFPELFFATLTGDQWGIQLPENAIDKQTLFSAQLFVERYRFFFSGLIGDVTRWREWAIEKGSHNLLELTEKGGRFALQPVFPINTDGQIITQASAATVAIFNDSNIIPGSFSLQWISLQENRPQRVTVIYRDLQKGFPIQRSVTVRRIKDGAGNPRNETLEEEFTLDASGDVVSRDQAIAVGKFLANQKLLTRRVIEFQTAINEASVAPGEIIRVDTSIVGFSPFLVGIVGQDNVIAGPGVIPTLEPGEYPILLYSSGGDVLETTVTVTLTFTPIELEGGGAVIEIEAGTSPIFIEQSARYTISTVNGDNFEGYVFALGGTGSESQYWRLTSVTADESGILTCRAIEYAADASGNFVLAQGIEPRDDVTYHDIEG